MMAEDLWQATVNLDAWLQSMRQPGGYGGPVAHWWRDQFVYTGPGLDWRYEGVLAGYSELWVKTQEPQWMERVRCAAQDLLEGQMASGNYRMSRFELNPGTLGTPHEAAASLGLLVSMACIHVRGCLPTAQRNLDSLIQQLWDSGSGGFTDRPGVAGRVPNKLATLSQALCTLAEMTHDERYLPYAKSAIDDVLRFRVERGHFMGAVHQYSSDNVTGDGRLFPYYNARCIDPLLTAARVFRDSAYRHAAWDIMNFLDNTLQEDGSWPQIVYVSGRRTDFPRWLAGSADILRAYHLMGKVLPERSMARLLNSQLPSGGFPTAVGFRRKTHALAPLEPPDYRDLTPVVGWNDKVLRLLAALAPARSERLPLPNVHGYTRTTRMPRETALFIETGEVFHYGSRSEISKMAAWSKGELLWE